MPAGFVTYNDDYSIQLTDDGVFFSLVAKGALSGDGWRAKEVTFHGVSIGDLPMIALHSERYTWAALKSSTSTSVTYVINSTGPENVDYYLFTSKPPPANPSRCGLELYNHLGSRVFASDFPPMRPLGMLDQNGYSGLPLAGRKIAHVPLKRSSYQSRMTTWGMLGSCMIGGAYQGYQGRIQETQGASAVRAYIGEISPGSISSNTGSIPYYCSGTKEQDSLAYIRHPVLKSLVIDVTNY